MTKYARDINPSVFLFKEKSIVLQEESENDKK